MVIKKIQDMTERKKEERLLYLEQIISSLPGNVYWKNREGVYLGCNANTLKACFLQKMEDFIGKKLTDIMPEKYANVLLKTDEEVMSTGKPKILEEEHYDTDGNPTIYLTHKTPIFDEKGNVVGLLGVSFDITERKKLEDELRQAKKDLEQINKQQSDFMSGMVRLDSIISDMPGNVYWKDREGIYRGCNANILKIVGLSSPQELIGKRLHDLINTDYAEKTEKEDQEIMEIGRAVSLEDEGLDLEGNPTTYITKKVPLRNERREVVGLLGISVDIKDRKQYEIALQAAKEKAESANQAKSSFVANISHELRTPLNGILGAADLLSRTKLNSRQESLTTDVIHSGETLLMLIDDLLDFSKLEADKIELQEKVFDFKKMVEQVIKNAAYLLEGKKIKLTLQYDAPDIVRGDELRLRQILVNLVTNAIKYTKKGYIKVEIASELLPDNKAKFHILVIDTGIGIAPNKLATIFDRFTQVNAQDRYLKGEGGVGLGLAICRKLALLMGSDIQAKSILGKGSTFLFDVVLPLASSQSLPAKEKPKATLVEKEQFKVNYHVLLVEDEPINQRVATWMLEELGCTVELAPNGQKALELYGKNSYDLIFTDITLPDISGVTVAETICTQSTKKPFIVAVTAHALSEEHQKFLAAGVSSVIVKPIRQVDLIKILRLFKKQTTE